MGRAADLDVLFDRTKRLPGNDCFNDGTWLASCDDQVLLMSSYVELGQELNYSLDRNAELVLNLHGTGDGINFASKGDCCGQVRLGACTGRRLARTSDHPHRRSARRRLAPLRSRRPLGWPSLLCNDFAACVTSADGFWILLVKD